MNPNQHRKMKAESQNTVAVSTEFPTQLASPASSSAEIIPQGTPSLLLSSIDSGASSYRTSMRHGRSRSLVDQPPRPEPLQRERRVDRMLVVVGDGVGEDVAGA